MRSFKFKILLILFINLLASIANADVPTLQNTVEQYDPGRIANDLTTEQRIQEGFPAVNSIMINGQSTSIRDSKAANIKFFCRQIVLTGNTICSSTKIAKLYADKINKEISLAELEQVSQNITEYYRNAGYILSQAIIPAQEISSDGVAHIQIVEGHINKISIKGNTKNNVRKLLLAYGERIKRVKPVTLKKLERFAFLATDIPGAKVRMVLTKSADYAGAADLTFIVDEKNIGGFIAYNDYNSMVLGRDQYLANAHINNLSTASETALNGILGRFDNRIKYGSFTHRQQLNTNGLGARVAVSHIQTNPNMAKIGLEGFIIPGTATVATANVDYAWIRSHTDNLYVGCGIKYLNSKTTFGGTTLFNDDTRSANLNISYNFLQASNNYNLVSFTFSQGFKAFGAKAAPPSRLGEYLNFTKFDLYASNSHRFGKTKLSSFLAAKGQLVFNTVPSSETFIYGGLPFGAGYDLAEFSGDRGFAVLFEMQYPFAMSRCNMNSLLFAFIDCGFIWDTNNVQPTHQTGTSTGAGYRVTAMKHLNMDFIIAVPLKPSVINPNDRYVKFLFNIKLNA